MSYELVCRIEREMDEAILVFDFATEEKHWLPLSQVEEIHRERSADRVVMTDWIAEKKGFVEAI